MTGRITPLQRLRLEWLAVAVLAVALLAALLSSGLAQSLGNRAYDRLMSLRPPEPGKDIVIVAIDDPSLDALGGWPLSRKRYADLLHQLDDPQCKPAAIGIDLHFLDTTAQDAEFARRMASQPMVLPMEFRRKAESVEDTGSDDDNDPLEFRTAVPPLNATAAFGHINIPLDRDGVVRRVQLYHRQWPHLALRMVQTAEGVPARADAVSPGIDTADAIRRFATPAFGNSYTTVSLSEALRLGCAAPLFKDKFVLVGVTAPTLGDRLPTSSSVLQSTSMPGVEILASILDGIRSGTLIRDVPAHWLAAGSLALLAVFLASFLLVPLRYVLTTGLLLELLWFGTSGYLLHVRHLWLNPMPGALVMAAAAFGWAMLRHEAIVNFVRHKSRDLQQGTHATQVPPKPLPSTRSVVGPYQELNHAVNSMQQELAFLSVVINEMPEAVAVYDDRDELLLGNRHIQLLFDTTALGPRARLGVMLRHLQLDSGQFYALGGAGTDPAASLHVFDVKTLLGPRDFTLKTSVIRGPEGSLIRLLFLADVTELRKHQLQRDRTLRFLSHDMRTPIVAIMSLVRLNASKPATQDGPALIPQIVQQAKTLLQMADDFTFTVSAEIGNFRFKEELLETLLNDALEQVMPLAQAREQTMEEASPQETVFVTVDTRLFLRALVNVLANAIKFAPEKSCISLKTAIVKDVEPPSANRPAPAHGSTGYVVRITVANGIEVKPEKTEYNRQLGGFGIGLDFVENVLKKHNGTVHRHIPPTGNATVTLALPCSIQTEDVA